MEHEKPVEIPSFLVQPPFFCLHVGCGEKGMDGETGMSCLQPLNRGRKV